MKNRKHMCIKASFGHGLEDRHDVCSSDFFLLDEKRETALMSRCLVDGLSVQVLVLSALQV